MLCLQWTTLPALLGLLALEWSLSNHPWIKELLVRGRSGGMRRKASTFQPSELSNFTWKAFLIWISCHMRFPRWWMEGLRIWWTEFTSMRKGLKTSKRRWSYSKKKELLKHSNSLNCRRSSWIAWSRPRKTSKGGRESSSTVPSLPRKRRRQVT